MQFNLDFEKPLVELEQKIRDLREFSTEKVDFASDILKLEKKARITSYNVCYTKLLRVLKYWTSPLSRNSDIAPNEPLSA